MNDGITFTQLTPPEIRKLVRDELETFFANRVDHRIEEDEVGGVDLAMRITGLAKATIYSRVSTRMIPHRKRGKKLYFSRQELNDWIAAGRRKTQDDIANDAKALQKPGRSV
jgi:hypothetical protein